MHGQQPVTLRFGEFEFHSQTGELRRRGLRVRLTPQAKSLLRLLLSLPVRSHSREEIHEELWPSRPYMDLDHALNKAIHSVREALNDTGPNSRFIETIPRFGYRFLAESLRTHSNEEISPDRGLGFPIAVLPLRARGSSSDLLFIGDRITSALTDALTAIQGLRVRSETTVRNTFTKFVDPQRACESLGVRAILSGNLSVHEDELLVRIEAIDLHDGAQLCSAEIETDFPFERHVEKTIVHNLVDRLKPHLLALAAPGEYSRVE